MTQRERIIQLIEQRGLKKSFVARQLGISNSLFSLFIHNKQPLQKPEIDKLERFIEKFR